MMAERKSFVRGRNLLLGLICAGSFACAPAPAEQSEGMEADWMLGPFEKANAVNPVLLPVDSTPFYCPLREDTVLWESKDVFNPATVVRNDTLFLIYRAEDRAGRHNGTSRLGLASSTDGLSFGRLPEPVFYPAPDSMQRYEWEGGCEDPRVVEMPDGRYLMTYTAYDGQTARLCIATSGDLRSWEKHGLAFGETVNGSYRDLWSKSGAVLCRREGDRMIAARVNGHYWMYWGDTDMYVATSENLIDWTPVVDAEGELRPVFSPRPDKFDSRLVEPGPPPFLTDDGILFLYNSMNLDEGGDPQLPAGTYAAGQVLLDPLDPTRVLYRSENYFLHPEAPYELTGQVGNVCFIEGLAFYRDRWFLYYGTADSKIAVAGYTPR